jgi:hypothetical protein
MKKFKMTNVQFDKLMDASKPQPVMFLSGGEPMFKSAQENANYAWELLGKELGFDPTTVAPDDSQNPKCFTAREVT